MWSVNTIQKCFQLSLCPVVKKTTDCSTPSDRQQLKHFAVTMWRMFSLLKWHKTKVNRRVSSGPQCTGFSTASCTLLNLNVRLWMVRKWKLFLFSVNWRLRSLYRVDGVGMKLCKNLMGILTETEAIDTELLVYTLTLINKVQILLSPYFSAVPSNDGCSILWGCAG